MLFINRYIYIIIYFMKFANKNILDYWCNNTIIDCSDVEIIEIEEPEIITCQKEYIDECIKVSNKDYNVIIPEKLNITYINTDDDKLNKNNGIQYIRTERNNIIFNDIAKRNRKLPNTGSIYKFNRTRKTNENIRTNNYESTNKHKFMPERTDQSCDKKELFVMRKGSSLSNR